MLGSKQTEDVTVGGRLIGSVRALRVMLQSTAHVEGSLFHKSLSLEQGTHFEGESRPSEDSAIVQARSSRCRPHSKTTTRLKS